MTEIEDRWADLGAFIREQRAIGQLSLRKLSEMAGISNPYLSQIERGLRKPSAEILRQIAGALHISAETLYIRAGILDERDGDHDLVAEIRRDPFIDEEQKKTLVHIYESFRAAYLGSIDADGLALLVPEGVRPPSESGLVEIEPGREESHDRSIDDAPTDDSPTDDGNPAREVLPSGNGLACEDPRHGERTSSGRGDDLVSTDEAGPAPAERTEPHDALGSGPGSAGEVHPNGSG